MMSYFRIVLRLAVTVCAALGPLSQIAAEKPAELRSIIYNPSSESPALDGIAGKLFSDRYRVVAIKPGPEFTRARLRGHGLYLPDSVDPRPMRDAKTFATASVGFVVTADGLVRDVRVLKSTDKRVADFLMQKIRERRFAPAQYRGAPVLSLEHMRVDFGPLDERDYSGMYKDGMGVMGQRDR